MVDHILAICLENGIQVEWNENACRLRTKQRGSEEVISSPLRKSVFRAIIARFAAICNEQKPNSVSPYGGRGQISVGREPTSKFRVSFKNTPDQQWLRLQPLKRAGKGA